MGFDLEQARAHLLTERRAYWEGQLAALAGAPLQLRLDADSLPIATQGLRDVDRVGLTALRNCLYGLVRRPGFAAHFAARVGELVIACDLDAPRARYDYDPAARRLTITMTPRDPTWIGYVALDDYLRRGL